MPEEQLKVSIQGDASGLEQASKAAVSALDKIDESAVTATKGLDKIPEASKKVVQATVQISSNAKNVVQSLGHIPEVSAKVSQAANSMAVSAGKAGGALAKLKPGSNEATQSLINLSRVAQDAPFGFIGIANNINPLLESFQRLSKETGSAKGALSALGSSLMGAGGLGLAVGVVSSLLVVFGGKLFSSKSQADTLADSLKKVGEEADVAGKQIQDLASDVDFLNQAAKLKIDVLGGLDSQATNEQIKNTKEAVDKILLIRKQLQEKKDAINIFDFKVGTKAREEAENSVQKLSDEILKTIDDEADQSRKLFFLQQQLRIQTTKEAKDALDKQEDDRKKAQAKSEADAREALQKFKDWQAERSKIISEMSKDFEGIKIFSLPDVGDPQSNKELFDRLRKRLVDEADKQLPVKFKLPVLVTPEILIGDKTSKFSILNQIEKLLPDPTVQAIDPKNVPLPLKPTIKWNPSDFQQKYENFIGQVRDLMSQAEQGLAINLGEGIAAAISGQGLENAFKNVAVIMGDFISSLGKLLIKESIQIQLFKKAFAALISNPVAGIAAGIGLVALGAIIKNTVLPKPKAFAKGGDVPGTGNRDTVPAMLTPGEYVVTKDKAPFVKTLLRLHEKGIDINKITKLLTRKDISISKIFQFNKGGKVPAMLTPGELVVNQKQAPLAESIVKILGGGVKMPKMFNNTVHLNQGGFVPSVERSNPIQRVQNIISNTQSSIIMPEGSWKIRGMDLVYVFNQEQKSQRRAT